MKAQYLFQMTACVLGGGEHPILKKRTKMGSLNLSIVPHVRCFWAPVCEVESKIHGELNCCPSSGRKVRNKYSCKDFHPV